METILIVEDDAKLAGLLGAYLSKYDFNTSLVQDFNSVLETFKECSADLVLLDVNLPRYDGFYWCRQIRKTSICPILFIAVDRFEDDFQVEVLLLRKTVSEAVSENRRLFIRRGIQADIQVDEEIFVYSDAKWLRFMLTQILTNAVNYTSGTNKTVTVSSTQIGTDTILNITDQGIGISPEDLRRVFNPYFTGERGRQYHESTGMGLYLVHEICNRLGHKVELHSRPGEGTTIRLTFRGRSSAGSRPEHR